jgi:putative endonuclease
MKTIAVYIMSNKKNGTLYIGVTSDLIKRVYQHKQNYSKKSFTAKYCLHRLVYFEIHSDMFYAIEREKQLKNWLRSWKIELIESQNPTWKDLWYEIIQ